MGKETLLTMRRYRKDNDYWRIRAFLRQVFLLNDRRELSWQAYRFDYWRWHGVANLGHGSLEDIFLWETAGGQLAAVLNQEDPGQAYLQLHPGLRTPELEDEMLAVAEQHMAAPTPSGGQKLCVWANSQDTLRQDALDRRGYARAQAMYTQEYQRRRPLSVPVLDVPVAGGYTVRALGGADELPARSWVSWRAFHPNDPDEAYEGWEWYQNIQRAPLYRRDLDLVAVAPDGAFASFCTVWFDDVTRTGVFEPVGTAPEHQRLGLGKAVMAEGLRRLQRIGAQTAFVGSYSPPAHALYSSMGFTDYELAEAWEKET